MAEEYYVRSPESDAARGPYDIDKLQTLGEAGQITRETFYYDDHLESWVAIGSNEALAEQVFPAKKKLQLRSDGGNPAKTSLKDADDQRDSVKVEEMLAAAEGDTEETRHLKEQVRWQERAASIAIPALATICFVSALAFIYPSLELVRLILANDPDAIASIIRHPLLILGVLDLILGICLLLSATEIYPVLRFRAMLGAGFFGFVFWSQYVLGDGQAILIAASVLAYGIGTYVCTLTLNFKVMAAAALAGICGVLGYAYFTTLAPLLAAS